MERGRFYDGKQAHPRAVVLDIATLDLRIFDAADNSPLKNWSWSDVVVINSPGGGLQGMLSHKAEPDCRLVVADDAWAAHIEPHLAKTERLPGAPLVMMLCIASIVFAVLLFFASPRALDLVAQHIPYSWEDQLGSFALPELTEGKTCKGTPLARTALARLASSLDEEGRSFDVSVVNISVINALSLPGRRIIIFSGLINRSATPELLAGVIAHEVGHAHYRHPLRLAVQSAGGQLLLSLAFGDTAMMGRAMTAAHTVLMLKGSRAYELQADAYAVPALLRINVDPSSLMHFLDYMAKQQPEADEIPQWMNSHPITRERIDMLKGQIDALKTKLPAGQPPLSPAEWKAVRNYCKG